MLQELTIIQRKLMPFITEKYAYVFMEIYTKDILFNNVLK